jgi:hypothetical protein
VTVKIDTVFGPAVPSPRRARLPPTRPSCARAAAPASVARHLERWRRDHGRTVTTPMSVWAAERDQPHYGSAELPDPTTHATPSPSICSTGPTTSITSPRCSGIRCRCSSRPPSSTRGQGQVRALRRNRRRAPRGRQLAGATQRLTLLHATPTQLRLSDVERAAVGAGFMRLGRMAGV